jgi:3D-(3,5/4)-trihydroxycyclohexane-1,2-dione acylhydrolase (decyclizing)
MRLTVGQALVRYLVAQHSVQDDEREQLIPAMLGIFGHGNVAGLGQALDQYQGEMPFIQGRNEQALVHLASGYAKARRRRGALAVTASIGPGSTNMITGAAVATVNRLPVLLLPSDAYASRLQGPVLQQLESPSAGDVTVNDCFRPVARYFDRVTRPEQLLSALPEAMRVLTNPAETGAVVISLPQDVQSQAYDYPDHFFDEQDWEINRVLPRDVEITAAFRAIEAAERPLIIAGGGIIYSSASAELALLANQLGVPVAETFAGKGAVEDDAWWAMGGLGVEGNPAANALAKEADLVICLGTRLSDFTTGSRSLFTHPSVRFLAVNVCDKDARKEGAQRLVADVKLALVALHERIVNAGLKGRQDWRDRCGEVKAAWQARRSEFLAAPADGQLTQGQLIGLLQRMAVSGDTILAASGGPVGDLLKVWDATGGRNCHLEFGYSCMGYEIPGALGVKMANPEGFVTALIGDGTFLMQPSEIGTAVQEGWQVTFVIAQNQGYQCIRRLQMDRVGRHYGNEFRRREALPGGTLGGDYLEFDLVSIARGLGAHAVLAGSADEVTTALAKARSRPGPSVVVVPVQPHVNLPWSECWWDVAPAEVSQQDWVDERRRTYETAKAGQRWYG